MKTVLGWYNRGNCGDEAFKIAFKKLYGRCEFLYEAPGSQFDLILGGGDVIKKFYLDQIPKDSEFSIVGCGLGYESEIELLKDRKLKQVLFRNKSDVEIALAHGIQAQYCPDLAFLLDAPKAEKSIRTKKKLGVMLTDALNPSVLGIDPKHYYAEYFKYEIARSLDYLSEWYNIYFIPLSEDHHDNDHRIHLDVIGRMRRSQRTTSIPSPLSPLDTLSYVANMDLVITAKFHGVIFSTLAGTPFVNIGVTRKTQVFCRDNGLEDLSVLPYSFLMERFLESVKKAEDEGTPGQLNSVTEKMKSEWASIRIQD